jgi:hypothetical protein
VRALSGAASATPLPMAQVVAVLGLAFLAAAGVGALFALALYRYTRLERLTTLLIVTPLYVATLLAPAVAVAGTCLGLLFAVLRVEGFTVLGTFVFGAGWLGGVLTLNRIFWNFRFAHDGA